MKTSKRNSIKSIIAPIAASIIVIQSCVKAPTPAFSYEPSFNPEAGDSIFFINESLDANSYTWDFGDSYSSLNENPSNVYLLAGEYDITLTASNDRKSELIIKPITINEPTLLGIIVVEDDMETLIDNCYVGLYESVAYYLANSDKPHHPSYSDTTGLAIFMNLEALEYIVSLNKETPSGTWSAVHKLAKLNLNDANAFRTPLEFTANNETKNILFPSELLNKKKRAKL